MWWNDYVGLPFKYAGMTREGLSCWGLVRLVQKEVFGRDLPTFRDYAFTKACERKDVDRYIRLAQEPVSLGDTRPGDVVHMWAYFQDKKVPTHVGVIAEPGTVLHIEEGTHSMVERLKSKRVAWRIIGVYRLA